MTNDPFQRRFAADPSLFPQLADVAQDRVLIAMLGEADFRAASFLDQRILTDQIAREWMAWDDLPDAAPAPAANFIFHIGHVGSTLVSRLLAELGDVLPLREPPVLRTLSQLWALPQDHDHAWSADRYQRRVAQIRGWLTRRFRAEQSVMVKATSVVAEIADQLVDDIARAIFLYVPLGRYLETILAGKASYDETLALAPARYIRLRAAFPDIVDAFEYMPPVTQVAMSWLAEMATAQRTLAATDPRHHWVDFEALLGEPGPVLVTLAGHFGLTPDRARLQATLAGPIMRQYSKAPEHRYSPDLRRQLQAKAAADHAPAIAEAIAWVEAIAARFTKLGDLPIHGR